MEDSGDSSRTSDKPGKEDDCDSSRRNATDGINPTALKANRLVRTHF